MNRTKNLDCKLFSQELGEHGATDVCGAGEADELWRVGGDAAVVEANGGKGAAAERRELSQSRSGLHMRTGG